MDEKSIINFMGRSYEANLQWHIGQFETLLTDNLQSGQNKCSNKIVICLTLPHNGKWHFKKRWIQGIFWKFQLFFNIRWGQRRILVTTHGWFFTYKLNQAPDSVRRGSRASADLGLASWWKWAFSSRASCSSFTKHTLNASDRHGTAFDPGGG